MLSVPEWTVWELNPPEYPVCKTGDHPMQSHSPYQDLIRNPILHDVLGSDIKTPLRVTPKRSVIVQKVTLKYGLLVRSIMNVSVSGFRPPDYLALTFVLVFILKG